MRETLIKCVGIDLFHRAEVGRCSSLDRAANKALDTLDCGYWPDYAGYS